MNSSKYVTLSAYWFFVVMIFGGFTASVYEFFRKRNLGADIVEAGLPVVVWLGALVAWFFYTRYARNINVLISSFIAASILAASIGAVFSRPEGLIVFILWSLFGFVVAFIPRFEASDF